MKLKYKKIILLTTMSTMGIGLLTLSVTQDTQAESDGIDNTPAVEASLLSEEESSEMSLASFDTAEAITEETSVTITPTELPSPTPIPVYSVEPAGTYPEIDTLFDEYYKAKNNCDVDKLKQMLSNPAKVISQEDLQKETEYIEDYINIKTYTKKSREEGAYIVYVFSEVKFTGVNTPAPQLIKFYVITGADSKLKIYSDDLEGDLKDYYEERDTDADVIELIDMTNKASEEAKKKDEDLMKFWQKIDEIAGGKNNTTAEGDSAE